MAGQAYRSTAGNRRQCFDRSTPASKVKPAADQIEDGEMFNKVKSATLAGLLVAASALPVLAAPSDKSIESARDSINKGQYSKAVQGLNAEVQKNPKSC